jgi:hypothetical protein
VFAIVFRPATLSNLIPVFSYLAFVLLIAKGGAVEPAAGEPAKHADEERLGDQAAQGGNAAHPLWQTSRQV